MNIKMIGVLVLLFIVPANWLKYILGGNAYYRLTNDYYEELSCAQVSGISTILGV